MPEEGSCDLKSLALSPEQELKFISSHLIFLTALVVYRSTAMQFKFGTFALSQLQLHSFIFIHFYSFKGQSTLYIFYLYTCTLNQLELFLFFYFKVSVDVCEYSVQIATQCHFTTASVTCRWVSRCRIKGKDHIYKMYPIDQHSYGCVI